MSNVKSLLNKYPPPSDNPKFIVKWKEFLPDVVARENFKTGHLNQLAILCDLYLEYDNLKGALEIGGLTYESIGRNGLQIKMRPEVAQKAKVVDQIANYSKVLGLLLRKDKEEADTGGSFDV